VTGGRVRPNVLGGAGGWLWLALIILPIYYIVLTSLKDQSAFFTSNPLLPPSAPTLDNYGLVLRAGFPRYFLNSVLVTVGSVVPAVAGLVHGGLRDCPGAGPVPRAEQPDLPARPGHPAARHDHPIYWMITRAHLYDTLLALILPSIAFSIPISVLILTNFLRDVASGTLRVDAPGRCTDWGMLWRLALPLTDPPWSPRAFYNALNVWNAFLFPLILTQSPELRVLPLSLVDVPGRIPAQHPAVLASVVLGQPAAAGDLRGGTQATGQRHDRGIHQVGKGHHCAANKSALVVRGGWDGHRPVQATELFIPHLRAHGFDVRVEGSTAIYADPEFMAGVDLVLQCVTMSTIEKAEFRGLRRRPSRGAPGSPAGTAGIADSFRNTSDYLHLVGGQFACHPGKHPYGPGRGRGGQLRPVHRDHQRRRSRPPDHPRNRGLRPGHRAVWVARRRVRHVLATTTQRRRDFDPGRS